MQASPFRRLLLAALAILLFPLGPVDLMAQSGFDVERLVRPDVADQIQLSDQQRAEIQVQLQLRIQAKSLADPDRRAAEVASIEQVILGLLTDDQKAVLNKPQSGKLRFQFREISWDRVLEWFARQEQLTLVMDRVPPGTFTYSDQKEYSPADAIDLLNSVLMTRGYSLVRREKMLIVVELNDTLPVELIPRITIEQLPSRGRFELVSILFPIGTRPVDDVLKEIKPYLGSYGRALPLPQSKQLLVIENAGKMETINALIASVPEVKPPVPKPDPPPPPTPVFAAYSIRGLDSDATLSTIKKLIPSEQITVDSKTSILSAFVIPSQQQAIQSAIKKMLDEHSDMPVEFQPVLVTYTLEHADPTSLKSLLAQVHPTTTLVADPKRKLIVATGTLEQHVKLKATIDQLDKPASVASQEELRTYDVGSAMSPTLVTSLQSMWPEMKMAADPTNNRLIATGASADHQRLELAVARLRETPKGMELTIRTYALPYGDVATVANVLSQLAPKSVSSADVVNRTYTILATEDQHRRVAEAIEQLTKASSIRQELTTYLVPPHRVNNLKLSLTTLFPTANVAVDSTTGQVIVLATKENQEKIGKVIEELNEQASKLTPQDGVSVRLFVIDATVIDSTSVMLSLKAAFPPEVIIQANGSTNAVIVAGTDEQLSRAEKLIEDLQKKKEGQGKSSKVYPLQSSDPTALARALTASFPRATFAPDIVKGELYVTADEREHEMIAKLVEEMNRTPGRKPTLRIFHLERSSPTIVAQAISKALVRSLTAGVSADEVSGAVFVVGTPDDLAVAEQVVEKLDEDSTAKPSRQLKVFSVDGRDGKAMLDSIKALLAEQRPPADVQFDSIHDRLVVIGTDKQIASVEESIKQFEGPLRQLEIFPIRANDPASVRSAIQSTFSDTPASDTPSITLDESKQQLIVRATPEQLIEIRNLLVKLGETDNRPTSSIQPSLMRAIPVDHSEKRLDQLRQIWPLIRKNPLEILDQPTSPPADRSPESTQPPVMVIPGNGRWIIASSDASALDDLQQFLAQSSTQSLEPILSTGNYSMYLLKHAGARDIEKLLRDLYTSGSSSAATGSLGRVRIVADERTNGLLVYGGMADRTVIEQLLGALDADGIQESMKSILPRLVPVENTDAKSILAVVRDVYRSQLSADGGRRPIPVPAGVAIDVATMLQQINATSSGPLLTLGVDATSNSIVMRAPSELATEVTTFIELLDKQARDRSSTRIDIVPLKSTNVARIRKALDILLNAK